jgi:enoyl-CoA hydratase
MTYNTLIVEKRDGIATLKLNRPDRLNALSVEMGRELNAAIEELKADLESRVFVMTGEGRAFCAGEDVKHYPNLQPALRA